MLQSSTDGPASTYDGNNLSSHRDLLLHTTEEMSTTALCVATKRPDSLVSPDFHRHVGYRQIRNLLLPRPPFLVRPSPRPFHHHSPFQPCRHSHGPHKPTQQPLPDVLANLGRCVFQSARCKYGFRDLLLHTILLRV